MARRRVSGEISSRLSAASKSTRPRAASTTTQTAPASGARVKRNAGASRSNAPPPGVKSMGLVPETYGP